MNKCCFLVPTYISKFHWAFDLIKSYNDLYNDDNIFVVFTSDYESSVFRERYTSLRYKSIIYSGIPSECMATRKKFEGLFYIFQNTEYDTVACIDDDFLFVKTVDYSALFNRYLTNGKIYANITRDLAKGAKKDELTPTMASIDRFTDDDKATILQQTRNGTLYFWLNEIPIYQKINFLPFIKYINFNVTQPDNYGWYEFDWILYAYYLIAKGIMQIEVVRVDNEDLVCNMAFAEHINDLPLSSWVQIQQQCKTMCATKVLDNTSMENVFLLMHRDRSVWH